MRCPYCNAEIDESTVFCNNCGQAVQNQTDASHKTDAFWSGEKSNQQRDLITHHTNIRNRASNIQQAVIRTRRMKSKKTFFRVMLALFIACVGVLAYAVYGAIQTKSEATFTLAIASIFTICAIIIINAYTSMVCKKGAIAVLIPFIPLVGYYYFLYHMFIGNKNLFVPLEKNESAMVKDLQVKLLELKTIKKEEKNLINEYKMLLGANFKELPIQISQNLITKERRKINGWQVMVVIMTIIVVSVFVASLYLAPMIYKSM